MVSLLNIEDINCCGYYVEDNEEIVMVTIFHNAECFKSSQPVLKACCNLIANINKKSLYVFLNWDYEFDLCYKTIVTTLVIIYVSVVNSKPDFLKLHLKLQQQQLKSLKATSRAKL
jgi:hypothetical protein